MESVTSRGNAIYASSLRRKSSSKVTGLTGTLLSNDLTGLLSAKGGLDRRGRRRAFQSEMDLFVEAFGVGLFLFRGALAIRISRCKERSNLFGGSSSTFMVDIYSCFGTRSLESAFDGGFCEGHPRPRREGDKFPLETGLLASISFIFDNNVVAESLKYCRKCHILQQKKPSSTFIDARCIFLSMDEVER